jgi:protein phosphatase
VSFWQSWFSKPKPSNGKPDQETADKEKSAAPAEREPAKSYEVHASVQTDVGCVRDINEDSATFTRPQDPELLARKGLLTLVADGMGGCSGGEIASAMVIAWVPRAYYESPSAPHEALKEAFQKVNHEIFSAANKDLNLAGMGTTAVALAICGDLAYAAYVGDSRLYLIRDGRIYLMTQDHSLVFDLVQKGLITREDARNHEDRNVLVRSLGGRSEVEVSIWDEPMTVHEDDRFLLCSDGLHDLVEDPEILDAVLGADDDSATLKLIGLAKQRGGYDNVTAALVRIRGKSDLPAQDFKATREFQAQQA